MKCVYKFLDSFSEEWMWCTTLCRIRKWKNFFVVELNGAASEPTHIYDPKHSLFFAWKELARHITYMYEISVANNRMAYPKSIEQVWKNTDCISNKTIKLWTSNRIKWEWSLIGGKRWWYVKRFQWYY
jgi:hypothetical protein